MRLVILAVLIMLVSGTCCAQAPTVAIISSLQGTATYRSTGSTWSKAALLVRLPQGAQLHAAKGAKVTLSFVQGGRANISGDCTVALEAHGLHQTAGARGLVTFSQAAARSTALVPADVNIDQVGGAMRGTEEPRLDEPVDPLLLTCDSWVTDRPLITFRAAEGLDHFQLVLESLPPGQQGESLLTLQASGAQRSFGSTIQLQPGMTYRLTLTAGTESDKCVVHVLPVERLAAVRAAEKEAAAAPAGELAPLVALCTVYLREELNQPALGVAERLLKAHPDDYNVYHLMERIYLAQRQFDRAKEMHRKAIENGYHP